MDAISNFASTYKSYQISQDRLNKANKDLPKLGEVGLALVQIKLQEAADNLPTNPTNSDYAEALRQLHDSLPNVMQTQLNDSGFKKVTGGLFIGDAKEKFLTLYHFLTTRIPTSSDSQSSLPSGTTRRGKAGPLC